MSLSILRSIGTLVALVVAVAQPVFADETGVRIATKVVVPNQVAVYFGDLNLQSPVGADTLIARISHAAQRACGERAKLGPGFYVVRQRRAECVKQAEQSAVTAVNQSNVTAAYALRQGEVAGRIATR